MSRRRPGLEEVLHQFRPIHIGEGKQRGVHVAGDPVKAAIELEPLVILGRQSLPGLGHAGSLDLELNPSHRITGRVGQMEHCGCRCRNMLLHDHLERVARLAEGFATSGGCWQGATRKRAQRQVEQVVQMGLTVTPGNGPGL